MTCNMKLLVSTIGQNSLIIFSHKDINWLIFIDNLIFAILTHDGAKFKIPQNWINISDLNLLSFFFNTVTIWVLIYFLLNRCTGITVKWVLHTCTSKLERKKALYIYINTCYVFTITSAATAMHIQGCNIVLQKSFCTFII